MHSDGWWGITSKERMQAFDVNYVTLLNYAIANYATRVSTSSFVHREAMRTTSVIRGLRGLG